MRNVNCNVLSDIDYQDSSGTQIDANQLIAASFHVYFGDSQAAGDIKIQASNDICNDRYQANNFTVTNWTTVNTTATTSGTSKLITFNPLSYRWLRATYTSTATAVQTITLVPDVAGSLNSKYFLLDDVYYVWFDNGTGVDPAPAGMTGLQVVYTDDDSANTLGGLMATVIQAANAGNSFTASNLAGVVTVTNLIAGAFTPASDVNSGFTFAVTAGGNSSINVNMNAISM